MRKPLSRGPSLFEPRFLDLEPLPRSSPPKRRSDGALFGFFLVVTLDLLGFLLLSHLALSPAVKETMLEVGMAVSACIGFFCLAVWQRHFWAWLLWLLVTSGLVAAFVLH